MPLPNLLDEPLTLPPRIEPLPNQLTLPEPTMAPKTADKPPKTPRKKVTVQKPPAEDLDRDGMLREACGGQQSKIRWDKLRGGATSTAILDVLADIWGSGWGHTNPDKGTTWCAKGGAKPGIWFGIPSPIGPASLSGEKLAAAVRRLLEIPEPGLAAPETDDELLLRALNAGHDRWRIARENPDLPDGELYQLLKITWKKPIAFDSLEGNRIRAFYARATPVPAIWFDCPAAVDQPTLATSELLTEVRRVLDLPGQAIPETTAAPPLMVAAELPIDKIAVVFNDREIFDDEPLDELAASIRQFGILQSLTVTLPDQDGMHTLIAGERRLRAAKLAGLTTVPVRMRDFTPDDLSVARLAENLLRVDLSPIEQAKAFRRLLDGKLSQRDLADKLGLSQPHIANRVRLLKLPAELQERVISGEIGPSDARQLATWADRANVMERLVEDWGFYNREESAFPRKPTELLWGAIQACSRAMSRGADGPRFKVTEGLREQLDIVDVQVGPHHEERAFNTELWQELQTAARQELEQKKAKREAAKRDDPEQAQAKKPKPALYPHAVNSFWHGWVGRQLVKEFSGKLKPKQTDLLRRIALIICEDSRGSLQAHWNINFEDATVQLLTRPLDMLLDAIAADFLQDMQADRTYVLGDANEALAIAEACGITLDAFRPDAEALQAIPVELLNAWIAEYDVEPAQAGEEITDATGLLIDQLVEVWTPGWIPEALDSRTGPEA